MKGKAKRGKKASPSRRKVSSTALYRSNVAARTPSAMRQSVTIPGDLAKLIERKKQQDESISKVLVRYARLGIAEEERAEERAKERLREVVHLIQAAPSEEAAHAYVDELTEALFGPQRAPRA